MYLDDAFDALNEAISEAIERAERDARAEERERFDSLLEAEIIERAGSRWHVDEQIIAVLTELRRAIREGEEG